MLLSTYRAPSVSAPRDMRRWLLGGVAILPSIFLMPGNAFAQATEVEIATSTTTPVTTSTASSGNPANVTITTAGSVNVTTGTAVTVDSDNTLTNNGAITVDPGDNSVGILVDGTVTSGLTMDGDITLERDTPAADVLEPDYGDNRAGVWLNGGTFTGDITTGATSLIQVYGDMSHGILADSDLVGNTALSGDIEMRGQNSSAIEINGNVTGNISTATGANILTIGRGTEGIVINGAVTGAVTIGGTIQSTGYTTTIATGDAATEQAGIQGGSALVINGDITGGLLIDGPLPTEEVAEGDTAIATSGITVLGSAPAVHIGRDGAVVLGFVDTSAQSAAYGDWGFISRGNITVDGVYSGVASTAMMIENAMIAGGYRNDGVITAAANNALARGIVFGSGTSFDTFYNSDRIQVGAGGGNDAATIAILLDSGSSVSTFENTGSILSSIVSDTSDAIGIQDLSGSLTSIVNSGSITTSISDYSDGDSTTTADEVAPSGSAIAIDLSANTSGVTIQNDVGSGFVSGTDDRSDFGIIVGDVLLGSGNDVYTQNAGHTEGDISFGDGANSLTIANNAYIEGNATFGAGNDAVTLNNGDYIGNIEFGGGADIFSLSNGSTFEGTLLDSDGNLSVNVVNSTLSLTDATAVTNLTSLNLDSASRLNFAVADGGLTTSQIFASGAVTIGDGAIIAPVFEGAFVEDIQSTFLTAGTLNVDLSTIRFAGDDETAPFLFNFDITRDPADANALVLSIDRKTASEIGLSANKQGAYEPSITALTTDDELGAAIFNLKTEEQFMAAFDQLLAAPLDAPLSYARAQNNSVTSIITQRLDLAANSGDLGNTVWLQEGNYFVNRKEDADSNGYDGGGWILAAGVDTDLGPIDAIGLSAHFASAQFDEKSGQDFPFSRITYGVGAYGAIKQGNMQFDAQASYSISDSDSERNIIIGALNRFSRATWNGTQAAASVRASYDTEMSGFDVKPFISADFLSLKEDAYTETGGGDAIDLSVDERTAESARLNLGVNLGKTFELRPSAYDTGIPGTLKPNLKLAWSQELLSDPLEATMRYVGGTDDFTLYADQENGAGLAALDIEYENEYAKIHAGIAGSVSDVEQVYSLRVGIGLKW